jgi:hypothetical protein
MHLGLLVTERVLRLIHYLQSSTKYPEVEIWNNAAYRIFYYLKYISYPFFYGFLIDGSMKLAMPQFYKYEFWV